MADQTQTQQKSMAQELMEKFNYQPGSRTSVAKTFDKLDKIDSSRDRKDLKRVSSAPTQSSGRTIGDELAEKAEIELALLELTDKYDKLDVRFKDLIGKDGAYGFWDTMGLAFYKVTRQNKKKNQIIIDARKKKGDALEFLVNRMAEVVEEKHQKAIDGRTYAERLQTENIADMRRLDLALIDRLRSGYTGTFDTAQVTKEISKLEGELKEIDSVLLELEGKAQAAKSSGDIDSLKKYTDEMSQILEMKYEVLEGRRSAEGKVSDIRRQMLDSAKGVESAKGAIAESYALGRAITGMIDGMTELEIIYRYVKEDTMPLFKRKAKFADKTEEGIKLAQDLVSLSETNKRLTLLNEKLAVRFTTEVFNLIKTPITDIEECRKVDDRLREYQNQLNQAKLEWAESQQKIAGRSQNPHYMQAE